MHYVISVYQGVTMGMVLISGEGVSALTQLEGELGPATYMHLIGYCVGAIVGLQSLDQRDHDRTAK